MHLHNSLRNCKVEWDAIGTISNQVPLRFLYCQRLIPLNWSESFKNVCYNTFGVQTVPLLHAIFETVDVTLEMVKDAIITYDPSLTYKAHGTSGSILEDLIHRTSHTHPLFKKDSATVFTIIEESSRGTHYSNTIKPFKRGKNGQVEWLALLLSHVGGYKWEIITKLNISWLMSSKWNGKKILPKALFLTSSIQTFPTRGSSSTRSVSSSWRA